MKNPTKNYQSRKPTEKELFTGGKFPEFALFYNVAFFRVAGLINHLLGNPKPEKDLFDKDKSALENAFLNFIRKTSYTENDDKIFSRLKDYLWKGYQTAKNSSGSELTDHDKWLVKEMLIKLEKIRNFHSHVYHDNSVLEFSENLKKEIQNFHESAKNSFMEKYPNEVTEFEKWLREPANKKFHLFSEHDGKQLISQEGRTFFLSFFVTKGEMARFLQQRKGSKRNDSDKFRLKHRIYRYYTHRDGAARQHYGQEENILSTLPKQEQDEILAARQAYKLISFLNDEPTICADLSLFPLFLKNGNTAETSDELITFCREKNLLEDVEMDKMVKMKTVEGTRNKKEAVVKENIIELKFGDFIYHIGKMNFHKLLVSIVTGNKTSEGVKNKLQFFISERNRFKVIMETTDFKDIPNETGKITVNEELEQYYKFKLRNEKLKKAFGNWLEKFDKGNIEETNSLCEHLNILPIEIDYYDFFFEENEKPRAIDRFVEYAVKYLIDFNVTPDWHWMVEKFETLAEQKEKVVYGEKLTKDVMVNKRRVSFSPTIPSDSRLAITEDGHVTVGIYTQGTIEHKKAGTAPKYKFVLGHRAIKNLIIAHLEKKAVNSFFEPIVADIERIKNADQKALELSNLHILTENEIPASYKKALGGKQDDTNALRGKAAKRIDTIIETLEGFVSGENPHYTRAEKNRQIMRCYKFFDWHYPQDNNFKFLRKDEYQQMSVYHFCLEKRGHADLNGVRNHQNGKYFFLIKDIVQHMPDTIKTMLSKAQDVDDLLQKVVTETMQLLINWKETLPHRKGEQLKHVLKKLGIPNGGKSQLEDHIPFNIHPILVLRKFYNNELNAGGFSLSSKIRTNETLKKALRTEYYEFETYLTQYLPENVEETKKIKRDIIGAVNSQLTKDMLLWSITKQYLEKTSPVYRSFITGGDTTEWAVHSLRKTTVEFGLEDVKDFGQVMLQIKFHQLDDYLFLESKPIVKRVVWQLIKRHKAVYKPLYKDEEVQFLITENEKGYSIPYEEIFKEMQRVNNEALYWAKFILEWEKKIVDAIRENILKAKAAEKLLKGDAHINFREICSFAQLGDEMTEKIVGLRNKAFHAEMPDEWTYLEKEKDAELCQLLEYVPKAKYDYENRIRKEDKKR